MSDGVVIKLESHSKEFKEAMADRIEKALEEGKLPDNSTPDTPETVDTETENEPTVEETKPEEKDVQAVEKKKPAKKFKRPTTDQVFGHTWMGVIYDV